MCNCLSFKDHAKKQTTSALTREESIEREEKYVKSEIILTFKEAVYLLSKMGLEGKVSKWDRENFTLPNDTTKLTKYDLFETKVKPGKENEIIS